MTGDAQGHDRNVTFLSAAVAALQGRITASEHGYARDPAALEVLLSEPRILGPAMAQAIQEMIWNSTLAGMDEEARTAGLFSHLGSNLNWFSVMASWTSQLYGSQQLENWKPCDISWAYQTKHTEADRGGDFGVAMRMPDNLVRIALYQAKRARSTKFASVHRDVEDETGADRELIEQSFKRINTKKIGELDMRRRLRKLHQVHRLEIWRNYGILLLNELKHNVSSDLPWCRYVFWADVIDTKEGVFLPIEMNCQDIFKIVRDNMIKDGVDRKYKSSPFNIEISGSDFGVSLLKGNEKELIVSKEIAKDLLGGLREIGLPDFLAIDETGGDGGFNFWRELFSKSGLTVAHLAGSSMGTVPPPSAPPSSPPQDNAPSLGR